MTTKCSVAINMILVLCCCIHALSFSSDLYRRVPGIWKLKTNCLPYEADIRTKLQGILLTDTTIGKNATNTPPNSDDTSILLKLNQDGTFKQCNEGYTEGKWISGKWKILHQQQHSKDASSNAKLLLAMNRQYYGPQYDILLEGCLNGNENMQKQSFCFKGNVLKGKYLHPRTHPSFFDQPCLAQQEILGPFSMKQSLSTTSIVGDRTITMSADTSYTTTQTNTIIQNSDFYNKQFILTIEPLKERQQQQKQQQSSTIQPIDIRSMPIIFHTNNTCTAHGINKILRGRFYIQQRRDNGGHDDDPQYELSIEVSLFGAGRSAPGSVYSEGLGLTHDDERTYIGSIQQVMLNNDDNNPTNKLCRLYVQGTVYYGTDLGVDARPEAVAMFYLSEDTSLSCSSDSQHRRSTNNNRMMWGDTDDLVTSTDDDDDSGPYSTTGGVFE